MPATYPMLGIYNFEQLNDDDFQVDFQIPDNCFYDLTEVSNEYFIAIKLNPGETNPSTSFTTCNETVTPTSKTFITTFEQHEKVSVTRKPKITIDF